MFGGGARQALNRIGNSIDNGVLPLKTAKDYGASGLVARGSGIDYGLRQDDPYSYYEELD